MCTQYRKVPNGFPEHLSLTVTPDITGTLPWHSAKALEAHHVLPVAAKPELASRCAAGIYIVAMAASNVYVAFSALCILV